MTSRIISTPYSKGYEAAIWGKVESINPYMAGSHEFKRWQAGYKRGTKLAWCVSAIKHKEVRRNA